ncbi:MAG: putative sulfate exporter family transporter [Myxococcaceae bacterium]|nr:putative sulfate exporter family transporter [Myxococcaceae bacterium]
MLFFLGLAAALTPWVSAPVALVAGVVLALTAGTPFPEQLKRAQGFLLKAAVVGLGAGMDLTVVLRVGQQGLVPTAVLVPGVVLAAVGLSRLMGAERTTGVLIGIGTAVCGGSAIAAAAPAMGARPHQSSVALAVVFLLNALALLVFPWAGHQLGLSERDFGLWSALAIHDTSSVVGASLAFGREALAVGTTVKLTRALAIIPLTLVLAATWKRGEPGPRKVSVPVFIFLFVAVAALVTWVPALAGAGAVVAGVSRRLLVVSLFLVGLGVSREALARTGWRPAALGVTLWVAVSLVTLAGIRGGVLHAPDLGPVPAESSAVVAGSNVTAITSTAFPPTP